VIKIGRVKGKGHPTQCYVTLFYNFNIHQAKLEYQITSVTLNHCACLYMKLRSEVHNLR